jgi:hypothetical protein
MNNTESLKLTVPLYALFRQSKKFKQINFDDIDAINTRYYLRYKIDAIKAHYTNIINKCDDIYNNAIISIGYKKYDKYKCKKCCKCNCKFDNCKKINCKYTTDFYDCKCSCACNNLIVSQFGISETFKHNENVNNVLRRGINEELCMDINNSSVQIDDNVYEYKDHHSGTVHNAYINIDETSTIQNIKTNNDLRADNKESKLIISIYGKVETLKNKIEEVLKDTSGFTSNEKGIQCILIIPICHIVGLFRYITSNHMSVGSNIRQKYNKPSTEISFVKSQDKSKKKLKNKKCTIDSPNIWSVLFETEELLAY